MVCFSKLEIEPRSRNVLIFKGRNRITLPAVICIWDVTCNVHQEIHCLSFFYEDTKRKMKTYLWRISDKEGREMENQIGYLESWRELEFLVLSAPNEINPRVIYQLLRISQESRTDNMLSNGEKGKNIYEKEIVNGLLVKWKITENNCWRKRKKIPLTKDVPELIEPLCIQGC